MAHYERQATAHAVRTIESVSSLCFTLFYERWNTMSDDLKSILDKLTGMEVRQGNIEQGIVNLGIRLEAVELDLGRVKETVAALDAKFDNQLQTRLDSINSELVSFRADTERGFRALDRRWIRCQAASPDCRQTSAI